MAVSQISLVNKRTERIEKMLSEFVLKYSPVLDTLVVKETKENIFEGKKLFVDPYNNAKQYVEKNPNATDVEIFRKIMNTSGVLWLGDWSEKVSGSIWKAATDALVEFKKQKALNALVLYNIFSRDNGSFSKGGAPSNDAYYAWLGTIESVMGDEDTVYILEPDAAAYASAIEDQDKRIKRLNVLKIACDILNQKGKAKIYVDISHPNWLSVDKAVQTLKEIDGMPFEGFSVNVSNFVSTEDCIKWADEIAQQTNKTYVIDTSRNGNGAHPDDDPNTDNPAHYINPAGRAIGEKPTTDTKSRYCDAYLWVKFPTDSDGDRAGAPIAGAFYKDYALELIRNSKHV